MNLLKLMPNVATIINKGELKESSKGTKYNKICIAIQEEYYWCAVFGATANYLESYAKVGAQVFLEEWGLNVKKIDEKTLHDIVISKLRIVKNGGDR